MTFSEEVRELIIKACSGIVSSKLPSTKKITDQLLQAIVKRIDEEELYALAKKIYYISVEFEKSGRQVREGRTEIFAELAKAIHTDIRNALGLKDTQDE